MYSDPRRDPTNWGADDNEDFDDTGVTGGGRVDTTSEPSGPGNGVDFGGVAGDSDPSDAPGAGGSDDDDSGGSSVPPSDAYVGDDGDEEYDPPSDPSSDGPALPGPGGSDAEPPDPDPDPPPDTGGSTGGSNSGDAGDPYQNDPRQDPNNWDPDVDDGSVPTSWDEVPNLIGSDSGSHIFDPDSEQSVARPLMNFDDALRSRLAELSGQETSGISLPLVGAISAGAVAILVAIVAVVASGGDG
ncbi:hypothetical protein [Halobellus limi]|uniref:Uncharacterized protein n=1 Tax=Halobellus limi TaxID=699433 RepID=A0A1H5T074_9EURY|nr:hypothetical protein [Halobellus limi]QCC47440.1 hypothetical protein DV707_07065 [Halobellus limi]SEF56233.1 hypothetical protein SAMN04488133_0133 [Halobellus limi]